MSNRNLLNIIDQQRIPEAPTSNWTWAAEGILYLKLVYVVAPDGLYFGYGSGSGFFSTTDINAFVIKVRSGSQGNPDAPFKRPSMSAKPLALGIAKPCYVVIQLHPRGNWEFRYDVDAMSTDVDDSLGADVQYFGLRHVLNNGDTRTGNGLMAPVQDAPAEDLKCRIAYFAATSPSRRGGGTSPATDHLNMFIRFVQSGIDGSDPQSLEMVIDPDIQNTGHDLHTPPAAS